MVEGHNPVVVVVAVDNEAVAGVEILEFGVAASAVEAVHAAAIDSEQLAADLTDAIDDLVVVTYCLGDALNMVCADCAEHFQRAQPR